MMRRLLIANRGEIVCRIARTARRLGVTSHCGVLRGRPPRLARAQSPMRPTTWGLRRPPRAIWTSRKILALAQRVGADAVHPGYGFLSENAAFAQACADAGLSFLGPPAAAIRAMGSKSASKAAMAAVGVPVAPGYHGDEQSPQRLAEEALRVGFPLIIKASAGGGGKGMQVVNSAAEVAAARRLGAAPGAHRVRRRPPAAGALLPAGAPRGSADVRRLARRHRQPVRPRLLGAAPPPEDHRGSAGSGAARRSARADERRPPSRRRGRWATSAPEPWNSWSMKRSISTSWK